MIMPGMIEVREYVDAEGNNPFRKWLDKLDLKALSKVEAAGSRMELGNFGDVEPVGGGVRASHSLTLTATASTS
jgi:putative component of toxin-antitoxin plasmid stabilization module